MNRISLLEIAEQQARCKCGSDNLRLLDNGLIIILIECLDCGRRYKRVNREDFVNGTK